MATAKTKAKPKAKAAPAKAALQPNQSPGESQGKTCRGNGSAATLHGLSPYMAKKNEEYMNEKQLEHFKQILRTWRRELMEEVDRTVSHMKDEAANFPIPLTAPPRKRSSAWSCALAIASATDQED